ncbi:MAG TPA: cation:proton antiporter [Vicinamibacterales bacterium]
MGIAGDFAIIVVAGFVGGIVARTLGLPLLVGYVAAGVVVGPNTSGPTVGNAHEIELLAELGVALLLFAIGLELSVRDLATVRRLAIIGGPLQILLTAALGTVVIHQLAGTPWTEAIWFGAMASLSSTMVVLKMLSADGTTATVASRVMIGMLVVQDLVVVPMLIALPRVSSGAGLGGDVAWALLVAAIFVAVMILVGTRLLPAILRRVLVWGSRELFLVAVVAAGVGVGYVTYRLGLSFALGAFVAGLVLSESDLSHQALSDVVPLRDVFALLFFVSVGMLLDPAYMMSHAGLVAALVATVTIGKALICGGVARAFGYIYQAPFLVGLGLSQVGEFSFVLARSGLSGGFLSKDTYDLALTTTVLSMAVSPLVFRLAAPIGRRLGHMGPVGAAPAGADAGVRGVMGHEKAHVVVAGYGRTGRAVASALQAAGVQAVVLDINNQAVAAAEAAGHRGVWGDSSSEEVLHAAGVGHALVFVVAVPDWNAARVAIERARRINPELFIVARATAARHLEALAALGVNAAVQPEFEGGVEMTRQALRRLERSELEIEQLTEAARRALYAPLQP